MICEKSVKQYCCEDISKIENYDKAIADKTQTWHCHHKAEILPCGNFSCEDLKKFGLYYNQPASELIFIRKTEHNSFHKKGIDHRGKKNPMYGKKHSQETKNKIAEKSTGRSHIVSQETKDKISKAKIGKVNHKGKNNPCYGKHCYTNGIENVRAFKCPAGFYPGNTRRDKKCR